MGEVVNAQHCALKASRRGVLSYLATVRSPDNLQVVRASAQDPEALTLGFMLLLRKQHLEEHLEQRPQAGPSHQHGVTTLEWGQAGKV